MEQKLKVVADKLQENIDAGGATSTFVLKVPLELSFDMLSDLAEEQLKSQGFYIGAKRWENKGGHAVFTVGYAESPEDWIRRFGK